MSTSSRARDATVLIVEDDPSSVRLLEEVFDELERDTTLFVVTDGVEAFDFLHNRGEFSGTDPPTLVILDLGLPGQSGQQILSELTDRTALPPMPVVVFSSTDDPETIDECYRLGANAYVVKPGDFEGTLTAMERLVDFWVETAETPRPSYSRPR